MTQDGIITGADLFPLLDNATALRQRFAGPGDECSITNGLQYDEWLEGTPGIDNLEDEDDGYDRIRQNEVDDGLVDCLKDIASTKL